VANIKILLIIAGLVSQNMLNIVFAIFILSLATQKYSLEIIMFLVFEKLQIFFL